MSEVREESAKYISGDGRIRRQPLSKKYSGTVCQTLSK